jgi:hypothetical protein
MSDSIVVSTGKITFGAPNIYEKMFVQSIMGSVAAIVLVALMILGPIAFEGVQGSDILPFADSSSYSYCDEVDWALNEWPDVETRSQEKRLNVVLTLFAAGEVSKSCLEKESQRFLYAESSENATAYLAQAFVHSDNPDLSNQYLSKVCDLSPDSSSCVMSKVVEDWSDSKWSSVEQHFASFVDHTPLHISVWALRHFLKRREYSRAEEFLNQLSSQPSLGNFLAQQRVRLFLASGRDVELNAVAETAIETLPSEGRIKIAQNICEYNIKGHSCSGTKSKPCQILKKEALSDHSILMSEGTAIQVARVIVCEDDELEYAKLLAMLPLQETHDYALALKAKISGKQLNAKSEFEDLADRPEVSSKMKQQLQLEVLSLMQSVEEFDAEYESWRQEEPDRWWGQRGEALLGYAVRSKEFEKAAFIGELLTNERFKHTSAVRPYVYSLLETGNTKTVESIMNSRWGREQLRRSAELRQPASRPQKSSLQVFHEELKNRYSGEAGL